MSDSRGAGWKPVSGGAPANGGGQPPARRSTTGRGKASQASTVPEPPGSRTAGRAPKKKTSWVKRILLTLLFLFLAGVIAACGIFLFAYQRVTVPEPDAIAKAETTTVFYNDGETELGSFSLINRTIIDTTTLPSYVGNAIVASEDRSFYTNSGVDLKGIARALVTNITTGTRVGGSTLSQQYVENYYVGEVTTDYRGKLREAIMALKINRTQSKEEILGNYMNTIYFGRGSYGIEAASQAYFGHPAAELTLSEAALLAGIIPYPSGWDPAVDPEQAEARWGRVLDLMVEDGWATQADVDAATFPETIEPVDAIASMEGVQAYLMDQVRQEIETTVGLEPNRVDEGGLRIITTLDPDMQRAAEEAISVMPEDTPEEVRIALSSVDNQTGAILAEYPGSDYQKVQTNAVTQDISQAGSTFKPFALLSAVQQGASVYDTFNGDSPLEIAGLTVENNDGYSFGKVSMVKATQFSINTAYVELNSKYGAQQTMETLIEAGIPEETTGLDETLLNVLGVASPHNIDLTRAYATLANGGERITPYIVSEVSDAAGNSIFQATPSRESIFDPSAVSDIMPALQSVTEEGGTGEKVVTLGRHIGGKTGTSDEQKSTHFVGFTNQITTAVSMYGVDEDGYPVSLPNIGGLTQFHGSDWPVDVWLAYMRVAMDGMPNEPFSWSTPVKSPTPSPTKTTKSPTPTPTTPTPTSDPTPAPEPTETEDPTPTPYPTPEPTETQEPQSR